MLIISTASAGGNMKACSALHAQLCGTETPRQVVEAYQGLRCLA